MLLSISIEGFLALIMCRQFLCASISNTIRCLFSERVLVDRAFEIRAELENAASDVSVYLPKSVGVEVNFIALCSLVT